MAAPWASGVVAAAAAFVWIEDVGPFDALTAGAMVVVVSSWLLQRIRK